MTDYNFFKNLFDSEEQAAKEEAVDKQVEARITSLDYIACVLADDRAMASSVSDLSLVEQMRDDPHIERRFNTYGNIELDHYDALSLILRPSSSETARRAARIALLNLVEEEAENAVMEQQRNGGWEDF